MISEAQKKCLMFIYEKAVLPIPWESMPDISKKERTIAVSDLVDQGLIDKRNAFNMRGICHLVVDCKVPFSEVVKVFAGAFEPMSGEIERAKEVLESDNAFNIFYYYNFKQYIEWDLFDENHNFKTMNQQQLAKTFLAIGLKMIDDGRVSHTKILELLNVPTEFLKDHPMTKEQAKEVFLRYKDYL